jgi:hypothetical protein
MTTTDELMKLYSECGVGCPPQNERYLRTAIEALVRERDAALTDAERYRWLRDDCPWVLCGTPGGPISRLVHRLPITYQVVEDVPDEMDAAIDAAIGEKTP